MLSTRLSSSTNSSYKALKAMRAFMLNSFSASSNIRGKLVRNCALPRGKQIRYSASNPRAWLVKAVRWAN
ncbi:MAG: hypothetical protein ACI9I4_000849 [Neolewinella sp.]|jgi:hypothetical protein